MLRKESLKELREIERRSESARKGSTAFQMSDLLLGRRASVSSKNSASSAKEKEKLSDERKRAKTEEKRRRKSRDSISEENRDGAAHYFSGKRTETLPRRPISPGSPKLFRSRAESGANDTEKFSRKRVTSVTYAFSPTHADTSPHLLSPQPLPVIPNDLVFPLKETEKYSPVRRTLESAEGGAYQWPNPPARSLSASTLAPLGFSARTGSSGSNPPPPFSASAVDDGAAHLLSYPSPSPTTFCRSSQPRNNSPKSSPAKSFPATALLPLPTLGFLNDTRDAKHVGFRSVIYPIVVMILLVMSLFLVAIPPVYFPDSAKGKDRGTVRHEQLTYIAIITCIISFIGGAMKYLVETRLLFLLSNHVKNAIHSVGKEQVGVEHRIEEELELFSNWLAMMKEKYGIVDGEGGEPKAEGEKIDGSHTARQCDVATATPFTEGIEGAFSSARVLLDGEKEKKKEESEDRGQERNSLSFGTYGDSLTLFSPTEGKADSPSPNMRDSRTAASDTDGSNEKGGGGSGQMLTTLSRVRASLSPRKLQISEKESSGVANESITGTQGGPLEHRHLRVSKLEETRRKSTSFLGSRLLPPTMPPFFVMSNRDSALWSPNGFRAPIAFGQSTLLSHGSRMPYSRKLRSEESGGLTAEEIKPAAPKRRGSLWSRRLSNFSSSIHSAGKEAIKTHITSKLSSFRIAPPTHRSSTTSSAAFCEEVEVKAKKNTTNEKTTTSHIDPQAMIDPEKPSDVSPSAVADRFVVVVSKEDNHEDDGKPRDSLTMEEESDRDLLHSCNSPVLRRPRFEKAMTPPPQGVAHSPFSRHLDTVVSPLGANGNPTPLRRSSKLPIGRETSLQMGMTLPPVISTGVFYPFPSAMETYNFPVVHQKPVHDAIMEELKRLHECLKDLFIDLYSTSNSSIRVLLVLMGQLIERVHLLDTMLMQWSLFVDHHEQFEYFFYQWERSLRKGKQPSGTTPAKQDRPLSGGGVGGETETPAPQSSSPQFRRSVRLEGGRGDGNVTPTPKKKTPPFSS